MTLTVEKRLEMVLTDRGTAGSEERSTLISADCPGGSWKTPSTYSRPRKHQGHSRIIGSC